MVQNQANIANTSSSKSRYFPKIAYTRSSSSIAEVELSVFDDPEKIAEESVVNAEMEEKIASEAMKKPTLARTKKNPLKTVTNTKTATTTLKQSLITTYDETNIGKKSLKSTAKAKTISENPSEEINVTRDKEEEENDDEENHSKIFPATYSVKAYSKSKPLNISIPAKSPAKKEQKKG